MKKSEVIQELADRSDNSVFYKAIKTVYGSTHNANQPDRDADRTLHEGAIASL